LTGEKKNIFSLQLQSETAKIFLKEKILKIAPRGIFVFS
jgi:hypothetical protein